MKESLGAKHLFSMAIFKKKKKKKTRWHSLEAYSAHLHNGLWHQKQNSRIPEER